MAESAQAGNHRWKNWGFGFVFFIGMMSLYSFTRPINHAESYDAITYSLIAENYPLGSAHDSRNILFHAVNRVLFVTSESLGLEMGAGDVTGLFSMLLACLALLLFARLMRRVYGVGDFASWVGASFLGFCYSYWRYAAETEVYLPSVFLVLLSLNLLCRYLGHGSAGVSDDIAKGVAGNKKWDLLLVGLVAGVAVLYYQANLIPLYMATFVLFYWSRISSWLAYAGYSVIGALVVVAGILWVCTGVSGHFPSVDELHAFMTERNSEFPASTGVLSHILKSMLAFGHDVFSAHWTQTIDPIRETLNPHVPGCLYNFKVAQVAGAELQGWSMIAPVLLVPLLGMLAWFHRVALKKWSLRFPSKPVLFLLVWAGLTIAIVGFLDPGSFEAWIPLLVPFAGLLTVFVFDPCCRQGKRSWLVVFLVSFLCYNFFGGMLIWLNQDGNLFEKRTEWISEELGAEDTVLLSEFDFRVVDFLCYNSPARIAHLLGEDKVVIHRSSPGVFVQSLDEFLDHHRDGKDRLFVLDDVLEPNPDIKFCKGGEDKYDSGLAVAARIKEDATLVDSNDWGSTFEIFQKAEP